MTVLYTQDFESFTVGATPTNAGIAKGSAASFTISNTGAVSGTKSLAFSSSAVLDTILFGTSVTTGRMQFSFKWGNGALPMPVARFTTTGNGYGADTNSPQIYKTNYTKIGDGSKTIPINPNGTAYVADNGDSMMGEIAVSGKRIEIRYWNVTKGQTRPTSPLFSADDTTYTSGYFGFTTIGVAICPIDDITITDDFCPAATAPATFVDRLDSRIYYAPSMWADSGSFMQAAISGAYLKTQVYGTRLGVTIALNGTYQIPDAQNRYIQPTTWVRAIIDGVIYEQPVWNCTAITLADNLTAGKYHDVNLSLRSVQNGGVDRWNAPGAVGLKLVSIDTDGTGPAPLAAPVLRSKIAILFSDSIGEGTYVDGQNEALQDDATATFVPLIAQAFDAEYAQICHAAINLRTATALDNTPGINTSWDRLWVGKSRLTAGLYTVQPDYILLNSGTNGGDTQADVATFITNQRAAAPNAWIIIVTPFNQGNAAGIAAAVAAAAATDKKVIAVPTAPLLREVATAISAAGGPTFSYDTLHHSRLMQTRFATYVAGRALAQMLPRRWNVVAA
jgi:hypothetical protein